MTAVVRDAVAADIEAVTTISAWAVRNTAANFAYEPKVAAEWRAEFDAREQNHPWLVATRADEVVGFAYAGAYRTRCAYRFTVETSVYVAPEQHGAGIGHALMTELMTRLRASGFHSVVAAISLPNPASERLHERHGFRKIGTLEEAGWKFERWHDVSLWQCALSTNPLGKE